MSVYNHLFDHRVSNTKWAQVGGACVGRRGRTLTRVGAPQNGRTPLFIAAHQGYFALVDLLVANGADLDAPSNVRERRRENVERTKSARVSCWGVHSGCRLSAC